MSDAVKPSKQRTLADQFAVLWESANGPPDVFAFLAGQPAASPDDQLAVLLVDQNRRWLMGQPRPVHEYFQRCPEMADPVYQIELVREEFGYRKGNETSLDRTWFAADFPDVAEQLLESDKT